jgi:hypothetical protein
MAVRNGFITLHRQILDWEWYKNTNTKVLFLHLLLKANYKSLSFEGREILRGQLVTSLPSLSHELGMSVSKIRSSLEHLVLTGEITSKTYPKYRVITIVKYDDYQDDDRQNGSQIADDLAAKSQANRSQIAGKSQASRSQIAISKQYKQGNNINKGTMEQEREGTAKRFTPPSRDQVDIFCLENGLTIDVDRFMDYYESNGWMVGKNHMKNWEATVRNWAARDRKETNQQRPVVQRPAKTVVAQQYTQRDYSGETDDAYKQHEDAMDAYFKSLRGEG